MKLLLRPWWFAQERPAPFQGIGAGPLPARREVALGGGPAPQAEVTFIPDKRSVRVSRFSFYVSPAAHLHEAPAPDSRRQAPLPVPIALENNRHSVLVEPPAFLERRVQRVPPPPRPLLSGHGVPVPWRIPRTRSMLNHPWTDPPRRVLATETSCCSHGGGPRRLASFLIEPEVIDRDGNRG